MCEIPETEERREPLAERIPVCGAIGFITEAHRGREKIPATPADAAARVTFVGGSSIVAARRVVRETPVDDRIVVFSLCFYFTLYFKSYFILTYTN